MTGTCSCPVPHEEIRSVCESSLFDSARILMGYQKEAGFAADPSELFHGRVCQWYEKQLAEGATRLLIMMPRGHLKSSFFTLANTLWLLIRDPNERILIVHASSEKTSEWIQTLESVITLNDEFHPFKHLYPELVPKSLNKTRWNSTSFVINRDGVFVEPSCMALGLKSTVTGGKYTTIILDDLVDETVAGSPETMEKAVSYLQRARFLLSSQRRGRILVVGTFWPGGFYEHILKIDLYKKLIIGCYHDSRTKELWPDGVDGTPVWPEEFPDWALAQNRMESSNREFSHQMLNIPTEEGMQRFESADIQYYMADANTQNLAYTDEEGRKRTVKRKDLEVHMTVDPSTGVGKDESAIIVAGWHPDSARAFVLEAYSSRMLLDGLINTIITLFEKWRPRDVGIEEGGTQSVYRQALRSEAIRRNLSIPLRSDIRTGGKSKDARLLDRDGLQPFFKRHQIYLSRQHSTLVKQLLDYMPNRVDQRDDLIDALAHQTRYWTFHISRDVPDENDFIRPADEAVGERWYGLEIEA